MGKMISLKNLKLTASLIALFLMVQSSVAIAFDSEEVGAFAGFIKELAHATQMPKQGVICTLGSDEISKIIIDQDKTAIDLDQKPELYSSCKAAYISRSREKNIRVEIDKLNKNKILTIATFDGFINVGGMVQIQMGRRSFELVINPKELKAANVKLSALYLSLIVN
jgi:YfiR/HmsC-like